jgi:hypothetical protein
MLNTPALQTNFSPASTAFWKQAYLDLATLLDDAGQIPYLQFGEVQWWYFPDDGSGMPFYDAYTTSTFAATYGHAMHVFTNSNVSPALYPDEAVFLSDADGIRAGEEQPSGGHHGIHDAVAERSDPIGGCESGVGGVIRAGSILPDELPGTAAGGGAAQSIY